MFLKRLRDLERRVDELEDDLQRTTKDLGNHIESEMMALEALLIGRINDLEYELDNR